MDLKKTALIAEILGGIGIIVSILYLGYEVSRNAESTEIANHLALIERNGELDLLLMSDPSILDLIDRGAVEIDSLSRIDARRFETYAQHAFNLWETSFLLSERDALPRDTWELWNKGWCDWLKAPGFRQLWTADLNRVFTEDFQVNVQSCYGSER